MRGDRPFCSVAQAQELAARRLPASVYGALVAGSERGLSLADNQRAFAELRLAPRALLEAPGRAPSLRTTVLGLPLEFPVVISPTGVQAVHPDGEVAVARAARSRGVAMGLSSFASKPIEQVVAAQPDTLFQIYWSGGRDVILARLERARAAGARALILTADWSFSEGRDWGSPAIPQRLNWQAMLQHTPETLARPRWLASFLRSGRLPDLSTPNMARPGQGPLTFFGAYAEWQQTPPPAWSDIAWLVRQWGGPFLLKGTTRLDDARRAVDVGVTALSVSNHGGNNLDGTPAAIRALPAVVDAVGHQVEVVLDGGVRRGADVVKALALGARAVLIGRAYLWGLAAAGQLGVETVLDLLRDELDQGLRHLRHARVPDLTPSDVVRPTGFERVLGR